MNGKYTIPPLAKIFQPNQEELNALHVHFEKLMGKTWEKSPYLNGISNLGITAIRNLNEQIHLYEDWQRTKNALELEGNYYGGFQFQLYPFTHQELTNEDLKTFSTEQAMGDLVTPYCQLGKHWLEVFTDQDMEIGLENISPLRFFGPNGYCRFFAKSAQEAEVERKKIVEFIQEYSEKRNIPFLGDSPSLAIGHSRLASLALDSELRRWSSTQRAEFFDAHDSISRVEIRIGAQVCEKKFEKKDIMFVESDFSEEAFIPPTESQINASRFEPHLLRR